MSTNVHQLCELGFVTGPCRLIFLIPETGTSGIGTNNRRVVYIDDVIVYGHGFESTLSRFRQLCGKLKDANLKVKPKKCHFFQKSVNFLAHLVSDEGIKTDPEKVAAINSWEVPTGKKAVT